MDIGLIIEIIILAILIFLSAFFSGVETALTSMTKLRIKQLLEKKISKANIINVWVKKSDKLLISILVGNNIVNIGAASLGALVVERLLPAGGSFGKAVAISWGLVTFLILTFGEIVPKSFARKHAEKVSIVCLPYLIVISFLLTPFNKIFLLIVRVFMRIIGSKHEIIPTKITEEEIKTIVNVGGKEGVIPEEEKELIHSIFEFGDTIVREIMTPRVDIIAVSEHE
ncbi:MAG: CNNM domain-containing protein, partial [Candidatus Auribacterota bacterium]|nr:CNNM domain-containing protein [Candidatus Auribacterota bacterium]